MNIAKRIAAAGKSAFQLYNGNDMDVYAGYATLFIVTAIFPCTMLIISVINMLPGYSPAGITEHLFEFLPDLDALKHLIRSMITNLKAQSTGLLASVSALTTLWSASSGVSSLQRGLKKLSPRGKTKMPDKATALLFTLILVVLIPSVIVFSLLGNTLIELLKSVTAFFGAEDIVESVAAFIQTSSIIVTAAAVLMILLTYAFLPGGKVPLKTQLTGTVFATVMWAASTKLFAFFIPRFYRSSGVYGSLASLFLLLLWLRLVITIFYYGAALNSVLAEKPKEAEPLTEVSTPV